MNMLFFDLENTPLVVYTWGLWEQNAVAMQRDWELLSVAYSWDAGTTIECIHREGEESDKYLTKALWKLLDKADVVVAHNGVEFDIKKANAKFAEHGLTPPSPYQVVDTLKIARSAFKFTSNKLDDLAVRLGAPRKLKHDGIAMWLGCMKDDKASWNLMRKYNKQDITALVGVYKKLAVWAKRHPNVARTRSLLECTTCGSLNLKRRGYSMTRTGVFQRYVCADCGKWHRATERDAKVSYRTVAL
jgi:uncharacterized protein YprB with RNaseH-like and TPR domain